MYFEIKERSCFGIFEQVDKDLKDLELSMFEETLTVQMKTSLHMRSCFALWCGHFTIQFAMALSRNKKNDLSLENVNKISSGLYTTAQVKVHAHYAINTFLNFICVFRFV